MKEKSLAVEEEMGEGEVKEEWDVDEGSWVGLGGGESYGIEEV